MDNYANLPTTLTAPAREGIAVTPSDTTDFVMLPRAIYVGQTGNVAAILAGGQTVTFQAVQAGSFLPVRMARILSTGTTASAMLALW